MTEPYTCNDFSFFGIFHFTYLMHDAVNFALTYENCIITESLVTKSGAQLIQGRQFETVYWNIREARFSFIN